MGLDKEAEPIGNEKIVMLHNTPTLQIFLVGEKIGICVKGTSKVQSAESWIRTANVLDDIKLYFKGSEWLSEIPRT